MGSGLLKPIVLQSLNLMGRTLPARGLHECSKGKRAGEGGYVHSTEYSVDLQALDAPGSNAEGTLRGGYGGRSRRRELQWCSEIVPSLVRAVEQTLNCQGGSVSPR